MSAVELRKNILLAIQVSLLGEITSNVRSIVCGWNDSEIIFKIFYDGEPSEDNVESMSCVETEMISHFPQLDVSYRCVATNSEFLLNVMPEENDMTWACVYRRKED